MQWSPACRRLCRIRLSAKGSRGTVTITDREARCSGPSQTEFATERPSAGGYGIGALPALDQRFVTVSAAKHGPAPRLAELQMKTGLRRLRQAAGSRFGARSTTILRGPLHDNSRAMTRPRANQKSRLWPHERQGRQNRISQSPGHVTGCGWPQGRSHQTGLRRETCWQRAREAGRNAAPIQPNLP